MSIKGPNHSLAKWADHIPSGWKVDRLGNVAEILFSNVDKHTFDEEEPVRLCNYVDVYNIERITAAIDFMAASALPREIKKFELQPGDVLATKDSEEPDDIAISSLVVDKLPGVLCGYHIALLRARRHKLCGPYLAWPRRILRVSRATRAHGRSRGCAQLHGAGRPINAHPERAQECSSAVPGCDIVVWPGPGETLCVECKRPPSGRQSEAHKASERFVTGTRRRPGSPRPRGEGDHPDLPQPPGRQRQRVACWKPCIDALVRLGYPPISPKQTCLPPNSA